ncbi:MAG: phosphodiester glycosidase family protein, partial [Clostridiales bacterium]|nr:phosphodiester glycosidase family protein [Clostridiales bacterium]
VKDGIIEDGLEKSSRAPRTAAGIKEDGSFVLYTVDGRQKNYSMGFSMAELAERMLDLGCVQAVNLDGGASTQLFATLPGSEAQTQINRDSQAKGIRSSGNYIVFKNDAEGSGEASRLYLYPYGEYLLSGASLQLEAKAVDDVYKPCEVPDGVHYSLGDGVQGSIDADGLFRAGGEAGQAVVSARAGNASGSVFINVVSNPDEIIAYLGESSQGDQLVAIGQSYQLSAKAFWRMQELKSEAACYSWSVEGDIGSIDEESGLFTAEGANGAFGTITCRAGDASSSIQLELVRTTPTQLLQPWILEIVDAAAKIDAAEQPDAEVQIGL